MKILVKLAKTLLGIIDVILVLIISLNVLVILSLKVSKSEYPKILDYTYLAVTTNNKSLNLNANDLLIIDTRKNFTNNNIVYYELENKKELGRIVEKDEVNVAINEKDNIIPNNKIIGPVVFKIPFLGNIITNILTIPGLIISIIIFIITNILGSLLNKVNVGNDNTKPNFEAMRNK